MKDKEHFERVMQDLYLEGQNCPGWYLQYQEAWRDGFAHAMGKAKEIFEND